MYAQQHASGALPGQRVQFDCSFVLAKLGPGKKRQAQIDGGGIERVNRSSTTGHFLELCTESRRYRTASMKRLCESSKKEQALP
ncbi:MAG: hypothetical protein QOH70_1312 [Blastocatellia bacterium]|jgi:hypothetical protein|nr:hypothetical protein [Blastocatellia bacterium]